MARVIHCNTCTCTDDADSAQHNGTPAFTIVSGDVSLAAPVNRPSGIFAPLSTPARQVEQTTMVVAPGVAQEYLDELSSLSGEAKAARTEKQAKKKGRKQDLHEAVTGALARKSQVTRIESYDPELSPIENAVVAGAVDLILKNDPNTIDVKPEPVRDCPHPAASRTTGKNWKCTSCGYQHG